jgi:hypothetical protein
MAGGADETAIGRGNSLHTPCGSTHRRLLGAQAMIDDHYAEALGEFDRLLNDPNVPIQPELVWNLLEQVIKAGYVCRDRVYGDGQT